MKKILTIITSALLCMTMLVLSPAQVIASAESNGKKYISEVKVGMGESSDEASKELLDEGYTILADDKGNYADLNEDAGSKSALKGGPNQKIVYLGYKTTDDPSDAITDLAVMNMNGGFSYQGYEKLMNDHMDTQIKPFVDRFIDTLEEYRENLKKPQDSTNYKRADYYRTLLNKLTDDDTGGKPLGDLLVNKTKYEMGDEAYNALSEEEKKEHCDILTLLMQGNGQAIQLMETQLTKASDSSDDTWLDRFLKTDLDALTERVKEETPGLTPSEINQELDKKYYDTAKKIRDKWSAFNEILLNYDNAIDEAEEVAEADIENRTDIQVNEKSSDEDVAKAMEDVLDKQELLLDGGKAAEDIVVRDFLEATKYGKGTLLEFFEKDVSEFSSEKKIRQLYPIVDTLSDGQLAGLDFLSIKDMIIMAFVDEKGFKDVNLDNVAPASIFEGVNREIYEKGGVALTNKVLRDEAGSQNPNTEFKLGALSIVLWSCTAATGIVAAGNGIASLVYAKKAAEYTNTVSNLKKQLTDLNASIDYTSTAEYAERFGETGVKQSLSQLKAKVPRLEVSIQKAEQIASKETTRLLTKSTICKYLAAGFTVATAILAIVSIVSTVSELMEYYKVDFAPIPKYIVEEADITTTKTVNGKPQTIMLKKQTAYYKVVSCNRTDGGGSEIEKKNHEILLDRADLNGDVGQQWLALYSVKYENGMPILADSLKFKQGKGGAPDGYTTGIHMFGEEPAQNLTQAASPLRLCYNDPHEGTYVFFKLDTKATAAGSLFSGGSLAIGVVIGLVAGCLITFAIIKIDGKKKKEKAKAE